MSERFRCGVMPGCQERIHRNVDVFVALFYMVAT